MKMHGPAHRTMDPGVRSMRMRLFMITSAMRVPDRGRRHLRQWHAPAGVPLCMRLSDQTDYRSSYVHAQHKGFDA